MTNNAEDLKALIDRRAHERREHERMTNDRRRKPKQTREQFLAMVERYCANKKGRKR